MLSNGSEEVFKYIIFKLYVKYLLENFNLLLYLTDKQMVENK